MKLGDKIIAIKDHTPHFKRSSLGIITLVDMYNDIIHALIETDNGEYKVEMKFPEFNTYFQLMDIRAIVCPVSLRNWMKATEQYLKDKA